MLANRVTLSLLFVSFVLILATAITGKTSVSIAATVLLTITFLWYCVRMWLDERETMRRKKQRSQQTNLG